MMPDIDLNNIQEWLQKTTGIESEDKQLVFLAISLVTTITQQNTMLVLEVIGMIKSLLGIQEEAE